MQTPASEQLNTREVASRLGISTSELSELRLKTDALPIEQDGLKLFYRMQAVQAYERAEALQVMECVLHSPTPLATLKRMAQFSGLSKLYIAGQLIPVNTPVVTAAAAAEATPSPAPELKRTQSPVKPETLTHDMSKGRAQPVVQQDVLNESQTLASVALWHVVHTKPRQEATAIENLQRQGYCCYMPTLLAQKVHRAQIKYVSEPMFSRYVFVACDKHFEQKGPSPIRSTIGVHEMVHFGSRPAVISLDLLQAIFERQKNQHQSPTAAFEGGDKVALVDGPLAGLQSIYQAATGEERSMILLNLLNRTIKLQVPTAQLTKVA
jgi:transcriptional antiterminator RfaH